MDGSRSAEEWYGVGDEALKRRDIDSAHDAFSRALELDPMHANALYRLGEIAQADGNFEDAEEFFRAAIDVNPGHAGAHARLERLLAEAPQGDGPTYEPEGDGIVGVVSALRQHTETTVMTRGTQWVWTFRVEARSPDGRRGRAVAAQMRGAAIVGSLGDGDWVELPSGWRTGQKLKSLTNLTTGERIGVATRSPVVTVLVALVVLFAVAWIAYAFIKVGAQEFK